MFHVLWFVDDEVVNNDVEKSGLKLATPPGCEIEYLPVEKQPIFLLVNMIANVSLSWLVNQTASLVWSKQVYHFETLNVGNMSQTPETRSITFH